MDQGAMEYTRIKRTVLAPEPEVQYLPANADDVARGGPAESGRVLAVGERYAEPVASAAGSFPAEYNGLVQFNVDKIDAGRCANCRENSRVRYMVKSTDQHGVRKWCEHCLKARYAIDV